MRRDMLTGWNLGALVRQDHVAVAFEQGALVGQCRKYPM